MKLKVEVERLVQRSPGLTASELAEGLFGDEDRHKQIASCCGELVEQGRIDRKGKGSAADPYRYF